MSSFVIKLIAIITMLCDHSGDAILGRFSFFNVIGRIAFPLFCFQIVIGYKHTKNVNKYFLRLFLFGIISQIPFSLFTYLYLGRFDMLNVFFTLAIGLLAIYVLDVFPIKYKAFALIIDIVLMILAEFAQTDYGWFGVCLIICIYLFYKDKSLNLIDQNSVAKVSNLSQNPVVAKKHENSITYFNNNVLFTIVFLGLIVIKYSNYIALGSYNLALLLIAGTFFSIVFMLLYNGKKGPSLKYLFYAFYPVHLLILAMLNYI